jgi:hypothetical protein
MIDVPLCFIDTETTHLDRILREVWEVGLIRREPDGTRTGFSVIVRDVDLAYAWDESLHFSGFDKRHPSVGGKVPEGTMLLPEFVVAQELATRLAGAYWVGAVPDFDEQTIWRLLRRHGFIDKDSGHHYPWHYHLIDVENLAAGALRLQPPWDFDQICARFGLSFEEAGLTRHQAIGDAAMNELLYDAVMLNGRRP